MRRAKMLRVRLTQEEWDLWFAVARMQGRPVSRLVRGLVNAGVAHKSVSLSRRPSPSIGRPT
jgi:hypothetical protein